MFTTIKDICELYPESTQEIEVFNIATGETVFSGDWQDCPDNYLDCDICSIDNPGLQDHPEVPVFNIDYQEDE